MFTTVDIQGVPFFKTRFEGLIKDKLIDFGKNNCMDNIHKKYILKLSFEDYFMHMKIISFLWPHKI